MNKEEYQYLNQIKSIIETGHSANDRTNTGTKSIFGCQMRFNLQNNSFPLLTTKKMFLKGIVEELLWFLRGDTNSKNLESKGVRNSYLFVYKYLYLFINTYYFY
jgi:thymidylate synthase